LYKYIIYKSYLYKCTQLFKIKIMLERIIRLFIHIAIRILSRLLRRGSIVRGWMLRHVTDTLLNLALGNLAAPRRRVHGRFSIGILFGLVCLPYFLIHLQIVQTHFYPSRTSSYHRAEKEKK